MHPQTQAIAHFEREEDAERAGHTIPLTKNEVDRLMPMNRAERRRWQREETRKKRRAAK
jgi:hypothetical protein